MIYFAYCQSKKLPLCTVKGIFNLKLRCHCQ